MIRYTNAAFHPRLLFTCAGSAFPFSLKVSLPCAVLAAALQFLSEHDVGNTSNYLSNILVNNAAYTAFTFLCGFLVVFRTQQGYDRFWGGCCNIKAMQSEWFAAASNLVAFCRHSDCEETQILQFHHVLLRLMSMLHAVSLAQLEGQEDDDEPAAWRLQLIDVRGLDRQSLDSVQNVDCSVEMILQWVQSLTVHNIKTGVLSIPPPILARVFHNLSNGLASFQQAQTLTDVPYPFPFMQATELLLVLHWLVTPMVMCNFTTRPLWAAVFSFLATFILWTLNTISTELENPFGQDRNDLNIEEMQNDMNKRFLTLLWPGSNRLPNLSEWAIMDEAVLHHPASMVSLQQVWQEIEQGPAANMHYDTGPRTKVRFSEFNDKRGKRSRKSSASFKGLSNKQQNPSHDRKKGRGCKGGSHSEILHHPPAMGLLSSAFAPSNGQGAADCCPSYLAMPSASSRMSSKSNCELPRDVSRESHISRGTATSSAESTAAERFSSISKASAASKFLVTLDEDHEENCGTAVSSSAGPLRRLLPRYSGDGDEQQSEVESETRLHANTMGRSQNGFESDHGATLQNDLLPPMREDSLPSGPAWRVPPARNARGDSSLETPRYPDEDYHEQSPV